MSIIKKTIVKIILFDGLCNLCNGSVNFIIKRDRLGAFKFASLQSEAGLSLLKQYGVTAEKIDSIVFIKEDRFFLRSSAVLNILKDLGGRWRFLYIFIIIPKFIRDFIYNVIAKSRYSVFGKREICTIPSEANRNRFLD